MFFQYPLYVAIVDHLVASLATYYEIRLWRDTPESIYKKFSCYESDFQLIYSSRISQVFFYLKYLYIIAVGKCFKLNFDVSCSFVNCSDNK